MQIFASLNCSLRTYPLIRKLLNLISTYIGAPCIVCFLANNWIKYYVVVDIIIVVVMLRLRFISRLRFHCRLKFSSNSVVIFCFFNYYFFLFVLIFFSCLLMRLLLTRVQTLEICISSFTILSPLWQYLSFTIFIF